MPKDKRLWSAWDFHDLGASDQTRVSLTADLKRIMCLDTLEDEHVLATLNPSPEKYPQGNSTPFYFRHPAYDQSTIPAQSRLDDIQGTRGIWYAGAWMGYGFHEDGYTKGVDAARRLCEDLGHPVAAYKGQDWLSSEKLETSIRRYIVRAMMNAIELIFCVVLVDIQ